VLPLPSPVLLLDVDGVLNPDKHPRAVIPPGFTKHRLRPGGERYKVYLSEGHGPRLLSTGADLVWATTWEHHANHLISPRVGLPQDLPVIEWDRSGQSRDHGAFWKTPQVLAWLEQHHPGRPWIWIDDDISDEDVAICAGGSAAAHLLLSPEPGTGMTDDDVRRMSAFTQEHA